MGVTNSTAWPAATATFADVVREVRDTPPPERPVRTDIGGGLLVDGNGYVWQRVAEDISPERRWRLPGSALL